MGLGVSRLSQDFQINRILMVWGGGMPFNRFRYLERNRVLLDFTGFYLVLLGFTGFYRVLLGFTEFYWVLLFFLGFTGTY